MKKMELSFIRNFNNGKGYVVIAGTMPEHKQYIRGLSIKNAYVIVAV
ncbi:hypothetical protein LIS77_24555 [Cytobacillus firmus]|nr:hypothetical protein [Cytobacillus firmus]MCS0655154.1 hypothetical protein [Cytobacillus firmus]USK41551.1 hypothetical protein LIS77_24555 [Cytobacillus firmus]WHY36794.1 hypothetical protein QNH44_24895 [Cytobacillus firmus]WHY64419.1 hypothetical protein QNH42_25225 [Cytobacillus firmus]